MEQTGLSHTTTFATFSLARLPGVTEAAFEQAMLTDVLPATDYPLNRSDNLTGQEFRKAVGDQTGAYQWVIIWNGVGNMDRIASGCETIYAKVKSMIDQVGTRTSLGFATLEGKWKAD